jgi:hypothetical protein
MLILYAPILILFMDIARNMCNILHANIQLTTDTIKKVDKLSEDRVVILYK